MSLRTIARRVMPAAAYDWLAARRQAWRRLYAYPASANLLVSDYDAYWREKAGARMGRLSSWRLRRAETFAKVVGPGDRVLDLGAGDGAVLRHLIAARQIVGTGMDISPVAVDFCRRQGLDVVLGDVAAPLEALGDGQWDYAILSEILEHLPHPERVVDGLRSRVRKGLLVSIPNTGYIAHRLRLGLGRFPLQWVVNPGEHLRFWTDRDFRWWARQLDFRIGGRWPYEGVRGLKDVWPGLFAAGIVYLLHDADANPEP
jgi:methionine biosynthesis protein MetW